MIKCPQDQCFWSGEIAAGSDAKVVCSKSPAQCQPLVHLKGFQKSELRSRFGNGNKNKPSSPGARRRNMNIGGYLVIRKAIKK